MTVMDAVEYLIARHKSGIIFWRCGSLLPWNPHFEQLVGPKIESIEDGVKLVYPHGTITMRDRKRSR